jgi:perosamine synthetase
LGFNMRIGRTLPPAASRIGWNNFAHGLMSLLRGEGAIEQFSSELTAYFKIKHCFLVSSGKAAFTLILRALKEKYPDRTEVIIPAYTCYSVPSAIVRAGLQIKPCDLAQDSLDFNFELLEPMLASKKLLAVLPTHLFGLPADVERLKRIVKDPVVMVIEDAAQAMGTEWRGKKLGTLGDVGFFSLGRGKAFSTVEGGIIITDDDDLAGNIHKQIKKLDRYNQLELFTMVMYAVALNIFLHPYLFWIPKGMSFLRLGETIYDPDFPIKRMTAFQAGLAKSWNGRLCEFRRVRQDNSKGWLSILDRSFCPFISDKARDFPELTRLPVLLSNFMERKRLLEKTDAQGFGVALAYPNAVNSIPECAEQFNGKDFPVAKGIAERLITLPVHQYLGHQDRNLIKECLTYCAKNFRNISLK